MLGAVPQSPKSDLPGDRTMQSSSPKMSKKTTGGKAPSKARVSAAIAFVRARNAKSPSHNENGMSQTSPRVGNSDTGTPRLPLTPSRMNSTLRANQAEGPEKPFFVSGEPQSIATKDNDVSVLSPPSSLGASSPCGRRSRRLAAAKYAETKSFASSPRRGLPPSPKFQEKSESTSAKQHDDNLDDTSLSSSEDSLDQKVVSDLADFIDALNKSSSSTGSDSVDRVEARSDNASSVASRELDASVLQSLGDFIDRLHHQKETACDANDAIQVTSSSSFSDDEAEVDPETLKQIASYIDTVTMAKSAFSPSSRSEKASAGGAASVSMDPIEPSRTTTNGNVYEDDAIDIGYSESTEKSPSAESAGGRIEDTASIKEGEAVELCSTKETETEISVSPTEANQGGKEGLKGDIFDGYDSDRFTEIGGETIEIGADSNSFDEIEANRDRLSDEGNNDTVSTSKLLERTLKAAHVAVQREQSSKPEIVDERDEQIDEVVASRSLEDIVECAQSISRSESSLTKVENDSLDSNEHVENISVSIEVDKSPSPQEELLNISKQTAYDAITASRSRDEYSNSVQGIHDTNPLIDSPSKSGSEDFQVESVEESECSESISKVMASLDLSESDETLGNNDEARTIKIVTSSRVASGNNVLKQKKHGLESKQSVESETGSKGDQDGGGNVSSEMASLDFSKSNETVGRSGDLSEFGIEQVNVLGNVSNPKYIDVVSKAPSHDSKFSTGGSAESDSLSKAMASLDLSGSGDTTERNAELSGLGIEHTATADTATNVSSRSETIEETACESRQRETIGLGTPSDIGNVSNAKYVDIVSEAPSHDSKSSTGGSAESDSLSKVMASLDLSGSGDTTERNAELSGLGIGEHIVTADTTANMSSKIETPEETTRESKQSVWNDAETIGSESFMNAMTFLDKGESDESAEKDSAASGCDVERAKTILSSVRRPEMEAGDGLDRDLTAPVEAVVEDPRSSELREDTSTSEWTEEEVLTSSWDEAVEITIGTSSHDNTLVVKKSTSKASASLGLSVSDGNNDVANNGAKTDEVISVERNESKDAVDSGSVHEECAKDIRTEDLFTSSEISSFLSTEKGDDHPMVTAASTSSPEAPTPEDRDNFLIESVLNALESDERTENMPAVRRAPSDDRESYLFNAFLAGSDTEISVDPIIRNYSTMDSIDEDDNIAKFQERTALRTATLSSSDARSEDSDKLTEINGDIIEISKDVVVDDGINLASASVAKVTKIEEAVTYSRVASGNNVLQQKKYGLESKQSVESETGSKGDQDGGGNVGSEMASLDFSKSNETVGRSGDLSELGIEQVNGLGNVSNPKYVDVVSQAPSHDSKFSTGGSAESDSLSKAMASLDLSGSGDTTERNAELSGLGIEHTATADTATNVSSRSETIEETACESRQRETIGLGTPSDIGNVSNAKYVDIVSEAPSHDSKSSTGGSAESDSLSKVMASLDLSGSGDTTERNAELSGLGIGEHIVTADTTANMSSKIETPEETTRESKQSVWNDAETIGSESFMNAMAFLDKGESDESAEKDSAASGCDVERAKTILSSVRRPEMEAGDGLDRDLTAPVEAVVEDPRSSELREDTSTSKWTEEEVLTSSWDEAVEITIGTSSHDNTLVVKKSTSKASASLGLSVSDGNNDVANNGAKTDEVISVERNESKDAVDSGSVHEECAKDIRTEDLFTSAEISSFLSTEKGDDHPMVTAASTSSPEAPTPEDRDNFLRESVLNALESDERTENMPAVRRAPSDDRESYLFNAFLAGSDTEISVDPIIRNYSTMDSIDEDDNIAKFQERTALRTATLSSSDARSEDSDKLTEINGDIIEISKDVVVDDGINLASASVAKVTEIITHVSESDSESTVVKTSEAGEIESPESYLFNAFLLASASDISVDPILLDPSTMKSVHEDDNIERFLAKTFTLPEGSTKQELLMLNTFIKEATDLIQNGGTVEQRQNLVKAAIRDGLPKDMVEEVIVSLVCESSKDEGKETPPPPPSPTPPLPAPSKVDDRSRQFLSITHCYIQKVYETSDTVNDESNEAPETDLSPEPPIPEPVSTSSSLKQELDNILSDTCEMNSMDEEDEGPAEEASVEKMGVMDTFIQKLAPREGASANEIELLSQFMKLAAPVMSGNRLSKDEEMKLRSTAAGVGISEKLLDELLRDTVSEKQEQPAPPGIVSEADGDPSESIANFRGSVVAGPNEISSSIGVDVEADADAVEVSMDMSYAEMKEMLIEDIEGEDHKHEECKSNDHINEDKNGDTSEETCATRKLTVKTDSGTADIAFENKVWSPIEDAGGERYAMPATPLSQMETPRITSTNGTSFEGMDTLLSPRSRLPLHRSRYSPSSKALVTPSKLGGSAAAAVISRWAPRRAGRKRLPIKQHWRLSYRERTKNHPGYFEVDVFSLMDMSVSVAAPHRLDDVPWEDREVKQRFLYEQSVSFSRNWFGVMPRRRGNDKYREPVARPDSMAMPMSHRQEQDWPNEWYSSWQSRKLFGEEEHDDGSSTSSFSSTSSRSSGERTGSILSGSVLSGSVLTRGTRDSGDSLDDYESDCESTWDYDDDGPECGHIVNVKQKIGERVSRVNPYTTSSLRRSRWRRKYFPRGTFPY